MELTIGCDPELYVFDKVKDRIVPAVGLIDGTKDKPFNLPNGGMVQVDGTLLEFGTPPVAAKGEEFGKVLKETLDTVRGMLFAYHGDRFELRCGAVASMVKEDLEDESALDVGCSPQFRLVERGGAIDQQVVEWGNKLDLSAIPAGGHIHVGFGGVNFDGYEGHKRSVKKFNDEFALISHSARTEEEAKRINILGGEMKCLRLKPYGYEARGPSAYWLAFQNSHSYFTERLRYVAEFLRKGTKPIVTTYQPTLSQKISQMSPVHRLRYQNTLPLAF